MTVTKVINKVESKLKREFVHLPIVSDLVKQSYNQKTLEHSKYLPNLDEGDREIVNSLKQEGLFKTTLDRLSIPKTQEFITVGTQLLSDSSNLVLDTTCQRLPGHILKNYPQLLRWGLDERLLDIAENYIGLPIFYLGVELRKELANGEFVGVRKWHLDTEDYRMMKIIIYLSDVDDENCGPFQCLPKKQSDLAIQNLRYRSGLISDDLMAKYVPREDWITCTGKKYTATIVDTSSILHRAKPTISKERLSITLHYISQYPIHLRSKSLSISSSVKHLYPDLSARQLNCLY